MTSYIIRRVLVAIPVFLAVTVLVFALRALVPGDPVEIMFFGESPPPEVVEMIHKSWGLDKPIYEQYYIYMSRIVKGDFGTSFRSRQPVMKDIAARYPNTLMLACTGLTLAVLLGVITGVISAVKQNTLFDFGSMIVALVGVSMPAFWMALLMMYYFSVKWSLLPSMGTGTWKHLVMPSLTLGLLSASVTARMVRSSMLEVLRQDFVRTARAKGLSERVVVYKHALKNALIPVVTLIGLQFGSLLGGAFITETVFAYHGLGELGVMAINNRDFPVVQGVILVISSIYVLVNLIVDVMYGFIDPRIRYS